MIAGILDDAERAARQIEPCHYREAFLNARHDDDAAGIGDDAARCHQMIGNRGSQRRQPGRVAILGQPRGSAVRQVGLQQPSPRFQRKQIGAGAAGKKIIQQPLAGDMQGVLRATLPQRHRHPRQQRRTHHHGQHNDVSRHRN